MYAPAAKMWQVPHVNFRGPGETEVSAPPGQNWVPKSTGSC